MVSFTVFWERIRVLQSICLLPLSEHMLLLRRSKLCLLGGVSRCVAPVSHFIYSYKQNKECNPSDVQ